MWRMKSSWRKLTNGKICSKTNVLMIFRINALQLLADGFCSHHPTICGWKNLDKSKDDESTMVDIFGRFKAPMESRHVIFRIFGSISNAMTENPTLRNVNDFENANRKDWTR